MVQRVSQDGGVDPFQGLGRAFEDLQEAALAIQQHAGHLLSLIPEPRTGEQVVNLGLRRQVDGRGHVGQ